MNLHSGLTLLAALALCVSHTAYAQKPLSSLQGLEAAWKILQPSNTDPLNNDIPSIISSFLELVPTQIRDMVFQSAERLTFKEAWNEIDDLFQQLQETLDAGDNITVSDECINDTVAMIWGLGERRGWAWTMVDAMGKPSPGFTEGNLVWPGSYDQCLNVTSQVSPTNQRPFSGQYCTAYIPMGQQGFLPVQIHLGICVPNSCSAIDLTMLIKALSERNTTQGLDVPFTCSQQDLELDTKAIVAIVICSIILFCLILGTALDVMLIQRPKWHAQENLYLSANGDANLNERSPLLGKTETPESKVYLGTGTKIFLAFSVYTNGSKLLSTNQPTGSLTCIHGIRFLSMTWVVLGHSFIFPFSLQTASNFFPYYIKLIKRWSFQGIANASVSVDTFFTMSGLLVAYLSLKEMKKKDGRLNWALFYFHRFWRLTPAYMLVIMVYVCLSPYWGEGALWPASIPDRDNCETSWWTNLLYINNFVDAEKLCLAQSWYLANDMQFYVLSPLIFVPFFFSPLFGIVSSLVFLLTTAIVPGALTMEDHFPATFLIGGGNQTANAGAFMTDYYVKPYNRMGPYVVGMLAGYFLYRTDCKLRINKWMNLLLWAGATGCALAVLYGLYDASNGQPLSTSVSALYNAVNRQVWALSVVWVIIACVTGNGGFVNTILSWPALIPLSRLTYCIYLLHIMIMELALFNGGAPMFLNDVTVVMFFLAILVVSYMASFVASLAFEAPMMGLEKVLLHK